MAEVPTNPVKKNQIVIVALNRVYMDRDTAAEEPKIGARITFHLGRVEEVTPEGLCLAVQPYGQPIRPIKWDTWVYVIPPEYAHAATVVMAWFEGLDIGSTYFSSLDELSAELVSMHNRLIRHSNPS